MRKLYKILIVVSGSIIFLILLAALLISPIVESYIEKNSKELTGRIITMENLKINIFTGGLKIKGFEMKEVDEKSAFLAFDSLIYDMSILPIINNKIKINKVYLKNPRLNISQNGDLFNFDDLIKRFLTDESQPEDSSSSYDIVIKNISLSGGSIDYADLAVGSKFDIKRLALEIPEVILSGDKTDVGFTLSFGDGGTLASSLKYDIEKGVYDLDFKLDKFQIRSLAPYVKQYLKISDLSGLFATKLNIKGNTEQVINVDVKGDASLDSFLMQDEKGEKVMSAERASVKIAAINPASLNFIFDEIRTYGLETGFVLEKDSSNNLSALLKELPDESENSSDTASQSLNLIIKSLITERSSLRFTDKTTVKPFSYLLSDISLTSSDFDISKRNLVKINGKVGKTGKATITWRGSAQDLYNQNIVLNFVNIGLTEFTPYTLGYFAYPVTRGNASFRSFTSIKSGNIDSKNSLNVYKIEVDKKNKEYKPEYNIPMKTALYILKDKNDKIAIDLPVSGNIKDPKFSYKKIIFKVFVNLIVKVATSPVTFLADALGLNPDKLSSVGFSETQSEFTNEQYDTFNEIASLSNSKPDLKLLISQEINYTSAFEKIAFKMLIDAYLAHIGKESEAGKLPDKNDQGLNRYADSLLAGKQIDGSANEKAVELYRDSLLLKTKSLADERVIILKEYFVNRLNISAEKLEIVTKPFEKDTKYEEKSAFKVTFSVPE